MNKTAFNITFVITAFLLFTYYLQNHQGLTVLDLNLSGDYHEYEPVRRPAIKFVNVDGIPRTYYAFVPEIDRTELPVLIALHGAGRDGISMVDTWYETADKYGFAVIGLDDNGNRKWDVMDDQQDFIEAALNDFLDVYGLEASDVYLFGHSNGAKQAIVQAVRAPNFFKRVAAHAGTLPIQNARGQTLNNVSTEIGLFLGDQDAIFSVPSARETVKWLDSIGMPAKLYILKNHTHWYYSEANTVNDRIWQYLESGE